MYNKTLSMGKDIAWERNTRKKLVKMLYWLTVEVFLCSWQGSNSDHWSHRILRPMLNTQSHPSFGYCVHLCFGHNSIYTIYKNVLLAELKVRDTWCMQLLTVAKTVELLVTPSMKIVLAIMLWSLERNLRYYPPHSRVQLCVCVCV